MSERITENIVRDLLRKNGYYDNPNIVVEEQKSSNPKIDKLLKNASKSGAGKGYPEFLISFKDNTQDIVVIECKAKTTRHESKDKKQYKDYAVDGVLLYADYLKNSFNVTAIAVSGESDRDKKISSFLWLREHYTYKNIQNQILLKPSEIKDAVKNHSKPLDENELIKKAQSYNEFLHKYSIPEVERCTLISAVLVSLQDKAFLHSFLYYGSNKALIKGMLEGCKNFLEGNGLEKDKIKIIISEYSKFENNKDFNEDTFLDKKTKKQIPNTILKDFISQINNEILPYIKNSEFDILGKFYTQFIRYAGSDKKTGLVLTPTHITDFFCEIAELNAYDVIFDPCCGTAGFLVSAMNYMLKKAGYDSEKQNKIKSQQLIGIEKRSDMFAHACSNMMMRGDGKSHIFYSDCFQSIERVLLDKNGKPKLDEDSNEIIEKFKLIQNIKENFSPKKAFLNPPYQDGNADEQLEFIENALECLSESGICVAICQMSTVVSDKKNVVEIRKRLLEKHTLEAVFSMPADLFHPIGVVTCILVFKAHSPHSKNKETFFGYFKDDGFIKSKNKGRIDANDKWKNIKEEWVGAYKNRKTIAGLSVMQEVSAEDEWCAEAYMDTDYTSVKEEDFIKTIKNYLAHQYLTKE